MGNFKNSQPYFVYQRITLISPIEYFFFHIDFGFYYLLRNLIVKYPEVDSTGAIFGPHLRFETVQRSTEQYAQDEPIPIELVSTPGSAGISINAAAQMTTQGPSSQKKFNVIYPHRDNIEIKISGQNGTTPELIDIVAVGYLIPFNKVNMWGENDGTG